MRLLTATAICAIALYAIDASFLNGQYLQLFSDVIRQLVSSF
jgi:hypothetical protein